MRSTVQTVAGTLTATLANCNPRTPPLMSETSRSHVRLPPPPPRIERRLRRSQPDMASTAQRRDTTVTQRDALTSGCRTTRAAFAASAGPMPTSRTVAVTPSSRGVMQTPSPPGSGRTTKRAPLERVCRSSGGPRVRGRWTWTGCERWRRRCSPIGTGRGAGADYYRQNVPR